MVLEPIEILKITFVIFTINMLPRKPHNYEEIKLNISVGNFPRKSKISTMLLQYTKTTIHSISETIHQ